MDKNLSCFQTRSLVAQRNALLGLSGVLSVAILGLSTALVSKEEKVVLVPSGFERESWVSSSKVSGDYLEQWAGFIAQALLTKSHEDYEDKARLLIKHVHPKFISHLIDELDTEAKAITKEKASYCFEPQTISAFPGESVELEGWMVCRIAGREISRRKERYMMRFEIEMGRPLLVEMSGGISES